MVTSLFALAACRSEPAPTTETSAGSTAIADASAALEASVTTVIADATASPSHADASADGAPTAAEDEGPAPSPALVARLRALAASPAALANGIDRARGVSVIHYLEAPPSGRGAARRTNERLCGAGLTRALPRLQRDLAAFVTRMSESPDVIACHGFVCSVPGMEYQPTIYVHFYEPNASGDAGVAVGDGGVGDPAIESIAHVSEAALPDEWVEAARGFADRSRAAARARPCPR